MSPELPEGLLPFLQELVRIPSLSGTAAERRCAERVVAEMRARGLEEAWTDAAGNAVGVLYGQSEGASGWVLLSHLDVVAAGDEAAWSAPPFGAELQGDLLHGRGSVDIKGAVASHLYALNALAQHRPSADTVMVVAAQEEIDGAGAAAFFTDLPLVTPRGRVVTPGACLVGEPSRNRLMLGHRGILPLTLRFPGQAHHAAAGDHATNPHFDLAVFLNRLRDQPGRAHPALGPDTLTPTVIVGDTTSQNVTPGELSLVLDWRYGTLGLQVQYVVPPPGAVVRKSRRCTDRPGSTRQGSSHPQTTVWSAGPRNSCFSSFRPPRSPASGCSPPMAGTARSTAFPHSAAVPETSAAFTQPTKPST